MRSTMRTIAPAVLACLCLGTIGCGALEAMDEAQGKKKTQRVEAEPGEIRAKNGWEHTTTIDPNALDESIVRCTIRGSVHFSKREECLHRGGRPESPKG